MYLKTASPTFDVDLSCLYGSVFTVFQALKKNVDGFKWEKMDNFYCDFLKCA